MKCFIPLLLILIILSCAKHGSDKTITTVGLLDEMVDLHRLTDLPEAGYRTIQYSSYDRRSTTPTDSCWFSNADGFGNEPIPAFEKVLRQPDSVGIGEYLICDIKQPGAIQRLWTAGLNGKIRLFLDSNSSPVYEGDAQDLFWNTLHKLSGKEAKPEYTNMLRQFDATYFPIPFSSGCRIEWIGDISKIHFYHIGIRVYESDVEVETFKISDFDKYSGKIDEVNSRLKDPDAGHSLNDPKLEKFGYVIPASEKKEIYFKRGTAAIEYLSLRINAADIENAMRKSLLYISFDNSSIPQVQVPVGDFFGTAPGLNPYKSLPFTVLPDSTMICRFEMPFKQSVKIEIENHSGEKIKIQGTVLAKERKWEEGRTMQFRARWKTDHGITTSTFDSGNDNLQDIVYLMASGEGRVVGAAAYIYNPSRATTSWGNWWGEGDEKIFVDQDKFPSFYGTGSEDYFNYSWSSTRIFSYPYCGQPRNDGPGNRGYVSNYRWHISDDILFHDKIAFYMELGHHGVVNDFSYGRIVYFYALPGVVDDFRKISLPDIASLPYLNWEPLAYLGSAGFRFIQAEDLIPESSSVKKERGNLWADGSILMWKPLIQNEKIRFNIRSAKAVEKTRIVLTLCHNPLGGTIAVSLNGKPVSFEGNKNINLHEPFKTDLVNHFSENLGFKAGNNDVTIESLDAKGKKNGIDFIWLQEP